MTTVLSFLMILVLRTPIFVALGGGGSLSSYTTSIFSTSSDGATANVL